MLEIPTERRSSNRRVARDGGRRATDPPGRLSAQPVCPRCHQSGVASLAGESEGGWWFVCLDCDHLWNQRQAGGDHTTGADVSVDAVRAPSLWRRLAMR